MEQVPNSKCSSSQSNPKTPINMPAKTKMLILSPDILNKLGIASQISNLTRLAAENSNNKHNDKKNVSNAKNLLENEIKQRLSKTLNKSYDSRKELNNKITNIEPSSSISLASKNSNENNTVINKPSPPKNKIKINEIKIIERNRILPNIIQSQETPLETIIQSSSAGDSSTESINILPITPESEKVLPTVNNKLSIVPKNDLNIKIKHSERLKAKKNLDDKNNEAAKSNKIVPKPVVNVTKKITVKTTEELSSFALNKPIKTYSRKVFSNTQIEGKKTTVNIPDIKNDVILSNKTTKKQLPDQKKCTENSVKILPKNKSVTKTQSTQISKIHDNISSNNEKKDEKLVKELFNETCTKKSVEIRPETYSRSTQINKITDNISSNNDNKKDEKLVKELCNETCTKKSAEIPPNNESLIKTYSRSKEISKIPDNISSNTDEEKNENRVKETCNQIRSLNKNPPVVSFTKQSINNFDDNSLADIPIIFEDELQNYVGNSSIISLEDSNINREESRIKLITVPSAEYNEKKSKQETKNSKLGKIVELLSKKIGEGLTKEDAKLNTVHLQENSVEVDKRVKLLSIKVEKDLIEEGEISKNNHEDSNIKLIPEPLPESNERISKRDIHSKKVDKSIELLSKGLVKDNEIAKENNHEVLDTEEDVNDGNEMVENVDRNKEINIKDLTDDKITTDIVVDKIVETIGLSMEHKSNKNVVQNTVEEEIDKSVQSEKNTDNGLNIEDKILQKNNEKNITINKDIGNEINETDFEAEQNVDNMEDSSTDKCYMKKKKAMISTEKELMVDEENTEYNKTGIQKKKAMKIDKNNVDKLQVMSKFPEQRREEFILPANRGVLEESDNYLVGVLRRENDNLKKVIVKTGKESTKVTFDVVVSGKELGAMNPKVEKEIEKTTNKEQRKSSSSRRFGEAISVKNENLETTSKIKPRSLLNVKEEFIETTDQVDEATLLYKEITPRKRGRPLKIKGTVVSVVTPPIKPEQSDTPLITETPVRKKGRPAKSPTSKPVIVQRQIMISNENASTSDSSSPASIPSTPRGRKRKNVDADNGLQVIKCSVVKCGVCHAEINNTQWSYHLIKHNYLAWRVGEEPIDLDDRKSVERVLLKAVKERKATFVCEFCGSKKRSALGYLGHRDICQISEEERLKRRVECPRCGKFFQPSSLKWHYRTHETENEIVPSDPKSDNSDTEIRGRRKAASKAASLIQDVCAAEDKDAPQFLNTKFYKKFPQANKLFSYIGISRKLEETYRKSGSITCKVRHCTHRTTSFKQLKYHIPKCPHLEPDDFICSFCLFLSKDENEMNEHIYVHKKNTDGDEFKYNDNDEDDNDNDQDIPEENNSDLEETVRVKKTTTAVKHTEVNSIFVAPYYKVNFLATQRRIPRAVVCTYPLGINHTLEFQQRNWCFKNLFSDFTCMKSNWKKVSQSEHHKYLPEDKESMNVKTVLVTKKMPNLSNGDHVWKRFKLFESEIVDDSITIFCGGPVQALAWMPTPATLKVDQYLAVSAKKKFEDNYKLSQSYVSEEVVQFWNFGCLDIEQALSFKPYLEFCIAHGHGNVWDMEWCPSGCYDEEKTDDPNVFNRMGLLALACSDGEIPVYAVCFPDHLRLIENEANIYRPKEHCRLVLQDSDEQKLGLWNYQVTKLVWSKGKGHDVIAAGYSSGMVSLWDLSAESPLLKSEENGITVLKPFLCFQPHFAPVSAIQLFSQDGGKRWLATGAWDRNSFLWDLHDIRSSVCTFAKRGCVTDGVLLMNWICFFFSSDDLHSLLHNVSIIQNPRDFGFRGCPILTANSMVMGLSGSDWGNAIAQVSLSGELIAAFPKQMLISFDPDKGMKYKRILLGFSEAIDITRTPEEKAQMKTKKSYANPINQSVTGQAKESYVKQPIHYEEAIKQYGLIFCDINLLDQKNIPEESLLVVKQSTRLKEAPIELYPFFCNNKVQWNPNKQAFLYIATAMQSGFVRLRCIRFLNSKYMKKMSCSP